MLYKVSVMAPRTNTGSVVFQGAKAWFYREHAHDNCRVMRGYNLRPASYGRIKLALSKSNVDSSFISNSGREYARS